MTLESQQSSHKRGFITQAYGPEYCDMAQHLARSYRLFGQCDYPFFVITDSCGAKKLKNYFDGVIIRDDFNKSTVDKLWIFTETPFDETVFIDADSSIVTNVSIIFDIFAQNCSDVSAIAGVTELNADKGIQFGSKAVSSFNIKLDFPNFNGGVYYFRKSEKGMECVNFMLNHLKPNYRHYQLMESNDSTGMYDEPLVIVSMLKYGFTPVSQRSNIMYLVHDGNKVKWNMHTREASFHYYDQLVHPIIIHWKFGGTETYNYHRYDNKLKLKIDEFTKIQYFQAFILNFIKYKIYARLAWLHPIKQFLLK